MCKVAPPPFPPPLDANDRLYRLLPAPAPNRAPVALLMLLVRWWLTSRPEDDRLGGSDDPEAPRDRGAPPLDAATLLEAGWKGDAFHSPDS